MSVSQWRYGSYTEVSTSYMHCTDVGTHEYGKVGSFLAVVMARLGIVCLDSCVLFFDEDTGLGI